MSQDFRLTISAVIWPGPVDGPLPITVFKILTPIMILTVGVFPATFFMGTIAALSVLFFYNTIWLEGSPETVNKWVEKLPKSFQKALKVGTISTLIPLVLSIGPFPLALAFRFLKFRGFWANIALVMGSYLNSLLWTGIIWGGGITILRNLISSYNFI